MAAAARPTPTKHGNFTNSQSIIYLTDRTNIYQEQDCLTTKNNNYDPRMGKENTGVMWSSSHIFPLVRCSGTCGGKPNKTEMKLFNMFKNLTN